MIAEKVLAQRYALTLFNLVQQGYPDKIETAKQELSDLAQLYDTSEEISEILNHPLISPAKKKDFINKVSGGRVSPTVIKFVELLINKNRIEYLPLIAETYDALADQSRGIRRVKVKSYFPLPEEQLKVLEQQVGTLISARRVIIESEIDHSLLGGIKVQIGDTMIDGSVSGRLEDMKQQLLK